MPVLLFVFSSSDHSCTGTGPLSSTARRRPVGSTPVDLDRLVVLGKSLAAEPELEADIGRRDDSFDFVRAKVELPPLDEERPLIPPFLRQLAGLDACEVTLDHAELSRARCCGCQ